MRCPKCGRQTQKRARGTGNLCPGILQAARADGTCYACYAPTVGPERDGVRDRVRVTQYREEFNLEKSTRSLLNYFQARQRRGVPGEGLHESTLVRPGLFLRQVR